MTSSKVPVLALGNSMIVSLADHIKGKLGSDTQVTSYINVDNHVQLRMKGQCGGGRPGSDPLQTGRRQISKFPFSYKLSSFASRDK